MKTRIISSLLFCLLILASAALSVASAGGAKGAYKLEGAWLAQCIEFPLQWSWVFAPDASGRRASGHGQFDIGPVTPDLGYGAATRNSHILVEAEMTGPDTVDAIGVWYGLREPSATLPGVVSADIVYIGIDKAVFTFETPDKLKGVHIIEYYVPPQDADGDGFPDPGQTPVSSTEIHTENTRLPGP